MSNVSSPYPFCIKGLDDFHTLFHNIHYQVSLIVCIFGSVTNILNFIVLTRKDLRTHINFILSGLAISDFLVMIVYIPFAIDNGFDLRTKNERLTYNYACYVFSHAVLSQTFHTISILLTVMLALWRYVAVCHPNQKTRFMKKTIHIISLSYIVSPIINIPNYLSLTIKPFNQTVGNDSSMQEDFDNNLTVYKLMPSDLLRNYHKVYLWIYSVVIKLLPCIVLTYLSLQLIHALYEAKKRKAKLKGNMSIKLMTKKKQADRTTKMLIAVLMLFLITEFPQGIMGLLSALLHEDFYFYCYQKLGDAMDFLALVNSSINFILYCTMSRQFRDTFVDAFVPKCLRHKNIHIPDELLEMDTRCQVETTQETQMTQL